MTKRHRPVLGMRRGMPWPGSSPLPLRWAWRNWAGLTGLPGGPLAAVSDAAIDMTPVPGKDYAIADSGSNKTALVAGILVLDTAFAPVTGRWPGAGPAVFSRVRVQRRGDPSTGRAGGRASHAGRRRGGGRLR